MAYRYNTNRLDVEFRKRLQNLEEDDTPSLGGSLDLNGQAFVADLLAGETLAVDDVCYLHKDGRMWKADASDNTTARSMLGISTEVASAGEAVTFVVRGFHDVTTDDLFPGIVYHLAIETGKWKPYPPTASGEIVRVLGYAVTTTQLFFDPDKTWGEIA